MSHRSTPHTRLHHHPQLAVDPRRFPAGLPIVSPRPAPDSDYCPRSTTNCKTRRSYDLARRTRAAYAQVVRGMQDGSCKIASLRLPHEHFIRPEGTDICLRAHEFHTMLTRLEERFEDCAAWTVYEFNEWIGVHLHALLRGVHGLTREWLRRAVAASGSNALVHLTDIKHEEDPGVREYIAHYFTKDLVDEAKMNAWPRGFHVTSRTANWCPEWESEDEWQRTIMLKPGKAPKAPQSQ